MAVTNAYQAEAMAGALPSLHPENSAARLRAIRALFAGPLRDPARRTESAAVGLLRFHATDPHQESICQHGGGHAAQPPAGRRCSRTTASCSGRGRGRSGAAPGRPARARWNATTCAPATRAGSTSGPSRRSLQRRPAPAPVDHRRPIGARPGALDPEEETDA